jgi:gamma-glutamylcysteine synthetase
VIITSADDFDPSNARGDEPDESYSLAIGHDYDGCIADHLEPVGLQEPADFSMGLNLPDDPARGY